MAATILCSAPRPTRDDQIDWRWAPGGPIHPVRPIVYARTFPHAVTLAFHIRIEAEGGTRSVSQWESAPGEPGVVEAALTFEIVDGSGVRVSWGRSSRASRFRKSVSIPVIADEPASWAVTAIIPLVSFPRAGTYSAIAHLTSDPSDTGDLPPVRLGLRAEMVTASPPADDRPTRQLVSLRQLDAEFGSGLSTDARRALRLAVAEARRLNTVSIGTQHLLIALVRLVGSRSGLPPPAVLRDATEQVDGLLLQLPAGEQPRLTPAAEAFIRETALAGREPIDAAGLLRALMATKRGSHAVIVEEALLLAERAPR